MERALTGTQIVLAKKREVGHPIIDVLHRREVVIKQFSQVLGRMSDQDPQGQQEFIRTTHGFLADDIKELPDYPLGSVEMVAIWSDALGSFTNLYQRYGLARVISVDFARRFHPRANGHMARYFLENDDYPAIVYQDNELSGLLLLKFGEINVHIDDLNLWFNNHWLEEHGSDDVEGFLNTRRLIHELSENFKGALFPLRSFILTARRKSTKQV